jgi:glycine/D-amino acid oxidase-like deaminating enzyme
MDARRVVHLDQTEHPADGPRSSLGHSIGRFEGDTLVIETGNYSEGVLNQYVEMPGQPTRGLLHSDALTSVERLRLDSARQRLVVTIDLSDPTFFTRGFDPAVAEYAPTELSIEPFNCRPENPDHTLKK